MSFSLTAIKENMRAGTAGLNGTARPGLLGTVKGHIKVRGVSAPGGFLSKKLFFTYFAIMVCYFLKIKHVTRKKIQF